MAPGPEPEPELEPEPEPREGREPGVPAGFVGRFERSAEFGSLRQYAAAVTAAIESRSRSLSDGEQQAQAAPIARAPLDSLGEDAFLQRWARVGRPVVLTGCTLGWDTEGTWNAASLRVRHGEQPWTARRGSECRSFIPAFLGLPHADRRTVV